MIKLYWRHNREEFAYEARVPARNGNHIGNYLIKIHFQENNPKGKWLSVIQALGDLPHDFDFSRTYFDAAAAQQDIEAWVNSNPFCREGMGNTIPTKEEKGA